MLLVALSLVMLLTSTIPVQARPVQQQSPAERLDLVPEGCDVPEHKPGEFVVRYESEEVMEKAPQENVAETYVWGLPSQRLVFDDIKAEKDPEKRRIMEEAKKKELEKQFGVSEGSYDERRVDYVWGPDHSPGEFWVRYESKEYMEKAPKENVVEERGGEGNRSRADLFVQRLRFKEIENETDSEERRDMEEAEMRRLQELPGVDRVGYAYPFVHLPGEFRVIYDSQEAMQEAPKEHVVWEEVDISGPGGSFTGVQVLRFEEIRDESNPKTRRDMEEAKIRELQQRPGVRDATYMTGDADPDCYWDTGVTSEGALNFANARHELYGYVCSSGGLGELFGGDYDAQRRLCGIYQSDPEACKVTHRPGEFIVHYRSEEAIRSAPRANVVQEKVSDDPHNEFFAQLLVFDEIKDEPEPDRQRIARIARLQELEKRPGVLDVRYAIVARERHQECVDAELGNLEGPGKPQSGEPVLGKAPAGKASSGEPVAGKVPPGEAAPGNKPVAGEPVASEPVASEPSSGKPESGLYDYVCSPEGLKEVFGGDVDFQVWFCIPPGGGGGGGWCYPNCNQGIVDRARELIGGGKGAGKEGVKARGKAGGRAAFEAAYEAARSGGNGAGEAVTTTKSNPGGSGTNGRNASTLSKPERAKAGKKDATTGVGAKGTGEAADDLDEEAATNVGGSGSGAGTEGAGGGGEAAGSGLQDAGEGAGETDEVSLNGDAADEREGYDDETGGYLMGFLSDAFYFVPNGNPGSANEGAGGTDAAGKETATGGTAATGEAVASEAGDGISSFLSSTFRGDGGGGAEGGDVGLGDAENAAVSRDRGTDSATVVLGVGALLAAGVLVARGFFRR